MSKRKESLDSKIESGLMTSAEAGSYLRCNTDTLRVLVREKQIGHYKLGHRYMFRKEDLDAYINSNRIDPVK